MNLPQNFLKCVVKLVTKNPFAQVTYSYDFFASQTGKHFKATLSKPSSSAFILPMSSVYVEWELLGYAVKKSSLV